MILTKFSKKMLSVSSFGCGDDHMQAQGNNTAGCVSGLPETQRDAGREPGAGGHL